MFDQEGGNKVKFWITVNVVLFLLTVGATIYVYKIVTKYSPQVQKSLTGQIAEIKNIATSTVEEAVCTDCVRRAIDGALVKPGQDNPYPVAMMIENHVDSRPPSSLSKANLVFEAEAEGGITRYLAVFADGTKLEKMGPVRSARSYYLDWAKEFSAVYAHCGGSPEALARIAKENIIDLNEFYNAATFWRDATRKAPHNVYTSSEKLQAVLDKKNLVTGKFLTWKFKDEASMDERPATSTIKIDFYLPGYKVEWDYDKDKNEYKRVLDGQAHIDSDGTQMTSKNIAIAKTPANIMDDDKRLSMKNIGEGKAVICRDGKCETGKWKKPTSTSRLRFYDANDEEISFNAGTTWIEIVRPEIKIIY